MRTGRVSRATLQYWSNRDGVGLIKEGCCGFRRVRQCGGCGEIFIEMELERTEELFLCRDCRTKDKTSFP